MLANRSNSNAVGALDHSTRRSFIAVNSALAAATAALAGGAHVSHAESCSSLPATPVSSPDEGSLQLIYSFEAQFTEMVLVGLTPRGIRYNLPYDGQVTAGPLEGADVRGIDYLLIRPDGVGVMDVNGVVTTSENLLVSYKAGGYVLLPEGVEVPIELMAEPTFTWPDMDLGLHGYGLYETGIPSLNWLNSTVLAVQGVANPGIGALSATAYAFTPIAGLSM